MNSWLDVLMQTQGTMQGLVDEVALRTFSCSIFLTQIIGLVGRRAGKTTLPPFRRDVHQGCHPRVRLVDLFQRVFSQVVPEGIGQHFVAGLDGKVNLVGETRGTACTAEQ